MKDFAALFAGRDDVHGIYRLPRNSSPDEQGKRTGKVQTVEASVTAELYQKHLDGELPIGIVPIRLDGTVSFFAIDVDSYKDADLHAELISQIERLALPLVVTRSKSNGAHLWCFLSEPIPAVQARDVAADFRRKLGLPEATEIFPKQDNIKQGNKGSWINLPYFGNTRTGLGDDGRTELSLEQFIEYANEHVTDPEDLKLKKKEPAKPAPKRVTDRDAPPPCIAAMMRDGVESGGRDKALLQAAIYYRKTGVDDWESLVYEFNTNYITPSMPAKEVAQKLRQASKGYQYTCKEFTSICDKTACMKLTHGIGTGGSGVGKVAEFSQLEWVDGEDGHYNVTMFGHKFRVSGTQLMNFALFRSAVLTHCGEMLQKMKTEEWEQTVEEAVAAKKITHAPLETQTSNRVVQKWQEWVAQFSMSESLEQSLNKQKPYKQGPVIQFRISDFVRVAQRDFPKASATQLFTALAEWGDMVTVTMGKRGKGELKITEYTMPAEDTWFEELQTKDSKNA